MDTSQGIPNFVRAIWRHAERQPTSPAFLHDGEAVSYGQFARLAHAAMTGSQAAGLMAVTEPKSPATIAEVLACLTEGRSVLLPPAGTSAVALAALCERAADPPKETCFVLTTSGSTGTPKLVPLLGRGVDNFISWAARQFGIGPRSVVLNYAPLNFDLCLLDVWATLARGGCAVLVDAGRAVWPGYLSDLLASTKPTIVQGVPLLYQVLAKRDLSFGSTGHVILTGDHAPAVLRARLSALFPAARCYNIYGCTETNDSFMHEFNPTQADHAQALPIGQPLPGVRTRIGDDGELSVCTPFQAPGYIGDDPTGRFDGAWFRTGDLVRREPSGLVYLTGRNDFQVKVRGTRVNLEQVEQALTSVDAVLEAAAVTHDGRIHLTVHSLPEAGLTPLTVRSLCAERLSLAMIPSSIAVVSTPLPRTVTGKIDRKQILRDIERKAA